MRALDNYVSFELSIHRIDTTEDQMGADTSAAWLIVPTIGVRH